MDARKTAYWTTTTLICFVLLGGGVAHLLRVETAVQGLAELGYPAHFSTILAVGKLIGVVTLLAPRLPRAKEWAYAGIAINLAAASFVHASVGHPAGRVITPLVFLGVAIASWTLRPKGRVMGSIVGEAQERGGEGGMTKVAV